MVRFKNRPLYHQGKSPWYPLDRRLGGPQSRSGRGGEEKNSQLPPGIERFFIILVLKFVKNFVVLTGYIIIFPEQLLTNMYTDN
jgi:hypothetical protein